MTESPETVRLEMTRRETARRETARLETARLETARLETARLWLEPLRLEDAEQVQPLFGVWETVEYLADQVAWPFPADGAYTYYRDVALPAVERGEQWHWTLRLKEAPGVVIGSIGLLRGERNNRGFWLGVPWRGRGLMTEAVERVTAYWFEELGMAVLRAPKASANGASVRISEKTGMRLESRQEQAFVSGRQPAETWVLTREDWLARRG